MHRMHPSLQAHLRVIRWLSSLHTRKQEDLPHAQLHVQAQAHVLVPTPYFQSSDHPCCGACVLWPALSQHAGSLGLHITLTVTGAISAMAYLDARGISAHQCIGALVASFAIFGLMLVLPAPWNTSGRVWLLPGVFCIATRWLPPLRLASQRGDRSRRRPRPTSRWVRVGRVRHCRRAETCGWKRSTVLYRISYTPASPTQTSLTPVKSFSNRTIRFLEIAGGFSFSLYHDAPQLLARGGRLSYRLVVVTGCVRELHIHAIECSLRPPRPGPCRARSHSWGDSQM